MRNHVSTDYEGCSGRSKKLTVPPYDKAYTVTTTHLRPKREVNGAAAMAPRMAPTSGKQNTRSWLRALRT
jgi:hypothetical protein